MVKKYLKSFLLYQKRHHTITEHIAKFVTAIYKAKIETKAVDAAK